MPTGSSTAPLSFKFEFDLFGTDNVAPPDQATQLRVFNLWDPIWALLTPDASLKIRKGNYERIFGAARVRVRAWEAANTK